MMTNCAIHQRPTAGSYLTGQAQPAEKFRALLSRDFASAAYFQEQVDHGKTRPTSHYRCPVPALGDFSETVRVMGDIDALLRIYQKHLPFSANNKQMSIDTFSPRKALMAFTLSHQAATVCKQPTRCSIAPRIDQRAKVRKFCKFMQCALAKAIDGMNFPGLVAVQRLEKIRTYTASRNRFLQLGNPLGLETDLIQMSVALSC